MTLVNVTEWLGYKVNNQLDQIVYLELELELE